MQDRQPGLLADERRQHTRVVTDSADVHSVFPGRIDLIFVLAADEIGLRRGDHVNVMALFDQRFRQIANVGRVPTVTEGRVESGDHAETHQAVRRA